MSCSCTENQFLSWQAYRDIACKTIHRFCPSYMNLLTNEEAIEFIIQKIMHGDWKWDANRKTSRKTYRCSCAQWAIREWVSKVQKKIAKTQCESLADHHTIRGDIQHWRTQIAKQDLRIDIENHAQLTTLERLCLIKIHVEQYTVDDLSQEIGMSKPHIYKSYHRGVKKLRQSFGV